MTVRFRVAILTITAALILTGVIVLLVSTGGRHGGLTEEQVVAQYAVLRRPQTAADRSQAARFDVPPQTYPDARVVTYADLPALTRVVDVGGVRVSLFVVHTSVSGVSSAARQRLAHQHQEGEISFPLGPEHPVDGDTLWATVNGVSPDPLPVDEVRHSGSRALTPVGSGFWVQNGPGESVLSVVPDAVTRVSWMWPREFNTATLEVDPPGSISAVPHANVAAAQTGRVDVPVTTTLTGAGGAIIARDRFSMSPVDASRTLLLTRPTPETPLSRRAERDPATPNRVVVTPPTGAMNADYQVFFVALLSGRSYVVSVRGPRVGCVDTIEPSQPGRLGPDSFAISPDSYDHLPRGETVSRNLETQPNCPGNYRVSVAVLGARGRPDAAFGHATFSVR